MGLKVRRRFLVIAVSSFSSLFVPFPFQKRRKPSSHYIVEIWIPNYGWVRGESTQGIFPYPKHLYTVCWIANIDDENYGGERGGVIAYWGFEDIDWSDAYWDFSYPEAKGVEEFATVKGRKDLVDALFEKGKEVWCLFCQLKNAGLIEDDSNTIKISATVRE
ncbi:MAG: hypothetical protein J7L64_01540 [Acidobacteria bacterium]|nr:hypothetical protein [Acidobacteriota bacterium]